MIRVIPCVERLAETAFRYHVGRHVANLQVTNTYEGTNVCRMLDVDGFKTDLGLSGYPCPHFRQGDYGYRSLRQLVYLYIFLLLLEPVVIGDVVQSFGSRIRHF